MNERRFSVNGQCGKGQGFLERNRKAVAAASPILDRINQKIAEAEKSLKALQPETAVWTSYRSEPADWQRPDEYQVHMCLGFMLHKGQWRLCHGYYHDCEPGPEDWKPLAEAGRRVRLRVAARFPTLFYELQERIVKDNEACEAEAQKALEKMIIALG
jgi:hypothetical protein